jgi:hypothetical protein
MMYNKGKVTYITPEILFLKGSRIMSNTEQRDIIGKSAGEIARDIERFLSRAVEIQARRKMDLANLLPDLNMREQFSFALLMEAKHQGWETSAAENFYLRFCAPAVGMETAEKILAAFKNPTGAEFLTLDEKYGCSFGLSSRAYWSSCFAVAVDAKAVPSLMEYFQEFVFTLLEFSYMGTRNPSETYVWKYYDSFQKILAELSAPVDNPIPLKVCSLGGTVGNRDADSYDLAFGLDIQNPNQSHMAWNVQVDVHLKDREGNLITTIQDRINCIDPGGIFHYGITRRIHGAAVAHISASAKTESFSKLTTPLMKHANLSKISINRAESPSKLNGTLKNNYDRSLYSYALHYQFLNADNKILGGSSEWFFEEFPSNAVSFLHSRDFRRFEDRLCH